MNLIKIGGTVLNVDRINGIQDHLIPSDPSTAGQRTVIRVLFDNTHIDLAGVDAKTFRRWYRHLARDISPRKDEDGEELISQEEQLQRAFEVLMSLIDRVRPRDAALRNAARLLSGMVDKYITGELEPIRASQFERHFAAPSADSSTQPDVFPS
jgi:hypothetical protein